MVWAMFKVAIWVGAGLLLAGVVLGFVKQGECGSVFQPRDDSNDIINSAFGNPPPDCSTAADYTAPAWVLIVTGGVVLAGGLLAWGVAHDATQETRDSHDANP